MMRVYGTILPSSFDPMFPSGVRGMGNSVTVWQKDTTTGTVHAIRLYRLGDGKQIGYKKVAGFTP
jgi:hypothetical protein